MAADPTIAAEPPVKYGIDDPRAWRLFAAIFCSAAACGEGEEIIRSWCEASHMRPHEVLGRLKTFIHCDKEWTRN
jgi:hypothetical protein